MTRTPIFDSLKAYEKRSSGYFRIPGHRFGRGIPAAFTDFAGKNIFKLDITETPMADDLHNPKAVIADSQRYTAEAFNAGLSFYLVNGTTCGNESMIIAAAGEDEKILIPRNAHKSVMAGLIISGARPVYMPVDYMPETGLTGILKPETASSLLKLHPESKAIFAVSPSYHGFCSDISALSEIAHTAGIPLLVDEAHGAHLYFNRKLPEGALRLGADCCAQSMHKTAGALTQASLLHLSRAALESGRIDAARIDSALRMTMSTSPSYLLICSLELARNDMELHGEKLWNETIELSQRLRNEIEKISGFKCPDIEMLKKSGVPNCDPTRLIINCDETDLTGYDLKSRLWLDYSIDVEMADERNVLLLLTYGNTEKDVKNLLNALKSISKNSISKSQFSDSMIYENSGRLPEIPELVLTPRRAYNAKHKSINWDEMKGQVIAEAVAPYPPGIPVIYPGEIITEEMFDFLNDAKKQKIHLHGPADRSLSTVKICDIT